MSRRSRPSTLWRSTSPAWPIVGVILLIGGIVTVATANDGAPVASDPPSAVASESPSAPPSASPSAAPTSGTRYDAALDLLATIPIKGRAPKTGYDREEQFGAGWKDPDRNGCDARNDVLARDLVDEVRDGPCTVLSGVLNDPYTGEVIAFVRGPVTSSEVQIDHVVALLNAWETGAQQLTLEQRIAFANDPLNLMAVGGSVNAQKGAGDAATWLPPRRAHWCDYVATQVEVKAKYDLWVTSPERDAMVRVLSAC